MPSPPMLLVFRVPMKSTPEEASMTTTTTPPEPCGYCRRCLIHDDPGGCLEVSRWEEANPEAAIASIQAARMAGGEWRIEELRQIIEERDDDRIATLARLHQQMCNAMADPEHPNVRAAHAQLNAATMDAFDRAEREELEAPSFVDTRTPALQRMTITELESFVDRWAEDTVAHWASQDEPTPDGVPGPDGMPPPSEF